MTERVLGVDACKRGWVGIALDNGAVAGYFAKTIAALFRAAAAGGVPHVVAIDIPIGTSDSTLRRADVEARAAAGSRWASVFTTPVRAALEAKDHPTANKINLQQTQHGVSAQAFGLRHKILEVEEWIGRVDTRVVEVHPEVSFARMAGDTLLDSKRSWTGAEQRRALLTRAGIVLPPDLGEAGRMANADDVLDAAAAAWTARRVSRGEATSLPDPPERLGPTIECAIWV